MNVAKDSAAFKSIQEITERAEALKQFVVQAATDGKSLYEIERGLFEQLLTIGNHAMNAALSLQGTGDLGAAYVTPKGRELRRSANPKPRKLRTIFGQHVFRQFVYSAGANRKIDLRPIDARLGLSPRVCSQLMEEFTQMFCVESAFRQATVNFEKVFRQKVSVDTLEAIARRMGAEAEEYADALPRPAVSEEGELLVATMDAKGVPLIQEAPAIVRAFETRRLRPGNRRMATLAGAYSVDRHIRTPEHVVAALFRDEPLTERTPRPLPRGKHLTVHFPERYGEGDDKVTSTGAIEACCWLSSQVDERRRADQPLVVLVDGDHRLWNTAADHLPVDRIEILDIVHVSSYIWEAAGILCDSERQREAFSRQRLLMILKGGAKSVIRGLRHMATARRLSGEALGSIMRITNYLKAHMARMSYDQYLKAGYPIATGVIEGACRHLVKDRMERSGMRWTLVGAKSLLNLRATIASGHWDEFLAHRRATEIRQFHPHREAIANYLPVLTI